MCALILHRGARRVGIDELSAVKAPPPEGRWFPLSHGTVLNRVKDTLAESGFVVEREELALSKEDHCFFGVLDMKSTLTEGVSLSVGVRNSTNQQLPLGFCAGSRTFVCDNLAFSAELLVRRKHTRFGEQRFAADIAGAMPKLQVFQAQEAKRIEVLAQTEVGSAEADSIILRAFEKGIVQARHLPAVIREWRQPSFPEFRERTYWSLLSAFTTVLGNNARKYPVQYAAQTMRLNSLVAPPAPRVIETTATTLAV